MAVEPFTLPKSISISIEVGNTSCNKPKTFLTVTNMSVIVLHYIFRQPEEKKRKKEKFELEPELDDFHPNISIKMEMDPLGDRPVRACRTQQGNKASVLWTDSPTDLSMPLTVFLICNITENECTPRQQLLEHFQRQLQRLGMLYSYVR